LHASRFSGWGAMDQRESFAEFANAPDVDRSEPGLVGSTPDIGDLQIDGDGASDGDGGMLGRVLIYACIVTGAIATLIWRRSG
jgi:hypothetical protein